MINYKQKSGIIFKSEKKHGTRITTTNVAGSLPDFEFMLDDCKDHILLVQAHWRLESELIVWQNTARRKGWHGTWEAAKGTEKNQAGVTGGSGGVAILTCNGRPMFASTVDAGYRV